MKVRRKAEKARVELEYAMKKYDKTTEKLESLIEVIELKNEDLMDKEITRLKFVSLEPYVKFPSCNGKKNLSNLRWLKQKYEDKISELEFDLASYSIELQKRLVTYFRTITCEE